MLTDYIERMARLGKRTAFVEQGVYRARAYTYEEVCERARAFSRWLEERGLMASSEGEAPRVLIWAPSSARWAMTFYGCVLAGAVVVPIDAGFSPEFVRRVAEQTRASLLVTEPAQVERLGGSAGCPVPCFLMEQLDALAPAGARARGPQFTPKSLLEIVYTSGTTTEPRGVMITHGNLLANLEPIEHEARRYKPLSLPFRPLAFLHLIPLSHLFGQVMALFIPQFLDGIVVFPESQAPAELARIIRARRVSLVISVPQQLEALGEWAAAQVASSRSEREKITGESRSIPGRWWKYRRLHRALGWKMWAFVVGGAALPPGVEKLWNALGYAVVQGYGLTETAPAIAVTHPFKIRRGAVGRPLPGVETRIAPDGEILVRGENVSPGYYHNAQATAASFEDGWLRTGDLGRFDAEGNLIYIGRKKDVIVTAEGLNVFPEDVEQALAGESAIQEVAVVGAEVGEAADGSGQTGRAVVHAVVVPAPGAESAAIGAAIEQANQRLEPHQRIRGYSLWPSASLPRTISTQKIRRAAIATWLNGERRGEAPTAAAPADWKDFLARLGVPRERIRPETRLSEDLGLSSLDRVELLTWFEARGVPIDEEAFTRAATIAEVEELARASAAPLETGGNGAHGARPAAASEHAAAPRTLTRLERAVEGPPPLWPHRRWVWPVRSFLQWFLAYPLLRYYVAWEGEGLEKLRELREPVLFIANHQSMIDAVLIFRAFPARMRKHLAPATGGDFFEHYPRTLLFLIRLFFNAFYLPEDPRGTRYALRHAGWLAERGDSILLFPEGARTPDGKLLRFRPGAGVMAERLRLPVVPLLIEGLFEIWPLSRRAPVRGRARLKVGEPMTIGASETAAEFTARVEADFRKWMGT